METGLQPGRVAAQLGCILTNFVKTFPESLSRGAVGLPSISVPGNPLQNAVHSSFIHLTRLGVGRNQYGHRLLYRLGQKLYLGELIILPLMGNPVLTPKPPENLYSLDYPSDPLPGLHPHSLKLGGKLRPKTG